LFIKDKFFTFAELLGEQLWLEAFEEGDFALFRLTPDKYHYNHAPVAGQVVDIYQVDGAFNSCNPNAIVAVATPYSKNRRVVTVIDTDVPGGTGVGLVAMVEVVALMIGDIVQCYSERGYERPQEVVAGMFIEKGQPKSLYRPGSSTDILIFQKGRVQFADDLQENQRRTDVASRFSQGFKQSLVETDIRVRSLLATAL
jgi:phosphatidylserine decarboxylase